MMAKLYVIFLKLLLIILAPKYRFLNNIANADDNPCKSNDTRIPIHIRSIITFESEFVSGEYALFVQAAADHVNSIDGILDGYQICHRWDHAEDPSHALSILYDYIYNGPAVPMMFGPPWSSFAALLNPVAGQFNIVQATPASSPAISDRTRFPLTLQTYPLENDMNPGRVGFIRLMKWKRVAIVFQDIEYFRENMNDLIRRLEEAGINILTVEAVSDTSHPDPHIQSLLNHDARIIIVAFYNDAALTFVCKAYQHGLYGEKYVFMLPGWSLEDNNLWHDVVAPCQTEVVVEVLQNSFYTHTIGVVNDVDNINFNGIHRIREQDEFWAAADALNLIGKNAKRFYYDSMILIAMALNSSIKDLELLKPPRKLKDFQYSDDVIGGVLNYNIRHTEFTGIAGLTRTNITRAKDGLQLYLSQYIDKRAKLILYFDMNGENPFWVQTESGNTSIRWTGNRAPVDGKTYLPKYAVVEDTSRVVMYASSSLGLVFGLMVMIINICYRNERAIKMTSPVLNNFIIIGGMLLYISIFAYGFDHSNLDGNAVVILCYMQFGCVSTGFTFAMGALLMKTFRVHTIFKKARKAIKVEIQDVELIRWLMALVALDVLVIVLWIFVDRIYITDEKLQPQLDMTDPHLEIYTVPVLRQCNSDYNIVFLAALGFTKTILLTFGVFLAWKTRNVAISTLNDSKYIAMSVYVIAIVVVLLIPAFSVTSKDVNVQFILIGSAIVFTVTAVLCLVFVPKIVIFCKTHGKEDFKINAVPAASTSNTSTSMSNNEISLAATLAKKQHELKDYQNQLYQLHAYFIAGSAHKK